MHSRRDEGQDTRGVTITHDTLAAAGKKRKKFGVWVIDAGGDVTDGAGGAGGDRWHRDRSGQQAAP